jgi:5'-nucleotidase
MGFNIEQKFVVAVASSALFNLSESDQVFRSYGEEEYRRYQREHENDVLPPGVAFPLIKRLLRANGDTVEEKIVEVVLLSKNDPDTGLRVFKAIQHYQLPITRAVFTAGRNPHLYMNSFGATLFLSGNEEDVKEAMEHGFPAGCVYPTDYVDEDDDQELRIAFDFDGIIADDSAEKVYQEGHLDSFIEHEVEKRTEPLPPGPLLKFLRGISLLQAGDLHQCLQKKDMKPKIRIAICTARSAPAHERVVATLRNLNIRIDEAFFLGGIEKGRVLKIFKPHIFFDDQVGHIEGVANFVPSVHVPFGVANKIKSS